MNLEHRRAGAGVGMARLILVAFLLTFIAARVLVYLIMSRAMPDLYLHMGGTHVHHLNYGIFLLSFVGAAFFLTQPRGKALRVLALLYGIGLALTFDEFGMWLHLGGPYWQRASFDAVVVIASLFGLIAVAPEVRRFRAKHWTITAVIALAIVVFAYEWRTSLAHAKEQIRLKLERVEAEQPK